MTTRTDDRPALAGRYLAELEAYIAKHDAEAIERLGFTDREGRVRSALARSARGAIQYAGGDPLETGMDIIEPYGDAITDGELRERARDIGGQVLDALGRSRARHEAARTLELVHAAGILPAYSDENVADLAGTIMRRARERAGAEAWA